MWLAVASTEVEKARSVLDDWWTRDLDEEARLCAETVVDLDADTGICPACQSSFRTREAACPDCGLRFGP